MVYTNVSLIRMMGVKQGWALTTLSPDYIWRWVSWTVNSSWCFCFIFPDWVWLTFSTQLVSGLGLQRIHTSCLSSQPNLVPLDWAEDGLSRCWIDVLCSGLTGMIHCVGQIPGFGSFSYGRCEHIVEHINSLYDLTIVWLLCMNDFTIEGWYLKKSEDSEDHNS